jgi:signal transduction histidine kinase
LATVSALSLVAIALGIAGTWPAFSWLLSLEILAIVGLIAAQAWIGRHDARVRLRLGILSIVVGLSAALYLLADILGSHLDAPGQFRIIIFPLNTLTFLGIGLAAGPVARFAAHGWIPRILLSLALALGTLLLDLLILMLVTRQEAVALGLAIGGVALVYVPLRLSMGQRAERRREARSRAIVELASGIAFAASPKELEMRWHAALQSLFEPKVIAPDDAPPLSAPQVIEEGIGLRLPAFQTLGPTVCRHADGGRRLFSAQDEAIAGHLARLLDQLIAGRDSYVRGIETERQRIARDLHDDVNGLLLAGLLRDDPERMRSDVRSAISEIRSIVRGANESNRSVANLIAEMRQEAATRLEAAGIALDWQVGEIDDAGLLAYSRYRHVLSIVREGVTNILRHAGARRVHVQTHIEGGMLDLVIADDGRRGAPLVPGNGLTNCKRRAELVGGTLVTLSSDRGVTLRLGVPIGD